MCIHGNDKVSHFIQRKIRLKSLRFPIADVFFLLFRAHTVRANVFYVLNLCQVGASYGIFIQFAEATTDLFRWNFRPDYFVI